MAVAEYKPTTYRIEPTVKAGLKTLSELTKISQNELVNDALKRYVTIRSGELASGFEVTAKKLRAFQKANPNNDKAIASFAKIEASVSYDPAEGIPFDEDLEEQSIVRTIVDG